MSSPPPVFIGSPGAGAGSSAGRRRESGSSLSTGASPFQDAQLAQDIDAARQMSRARANSITQPPPPQSNLAPNSSVNEAATSPVAIGHHVEHSDRSPAHNVGSPLRSLQTRFYMQHQRNGSNTSLDSASHFIDHRNQQTVGSPTIAFNRSRRYSSTRRDRMDEYAADEGGQHQMGVSLARSYHNPHSSPPQDAMHTPSRRPSLAEQDVCFPMPSQSIEEPESRNAEPAPHTPFYPHPDPIDEHQKVDQSSLPPGFPWTFDLRALEDYADQERKRAEEETATRAPSMWGLRSRSGAATIATVRELKRQQTERMSSANRQQNASDLMGISPESDDATFYSRRPRKFINAHSTNEEGKPSGRYQRKLALFEGAGLAPPPIGSRSGANSAFEDRKGGGGILGHGALMEEEVDRQRAAAARRGSNINASADTKTPLLNGSRQQLPSYQAGHRTIDWLGASDEEQDNLPPPAMSPTPHSPHVTRSLSVGADLSNLVKRAKGSSSSSKPARHAHRRMESYGKTNQFRFTFYSNALPNTIHARHLYELPAPGQTFEELLMGISPQSAQDDEPSSGANQSTANTGDGVRTGSNEDAKEVSDASLPDNKTYQSGIAQNKPMSALASTLATGRHEGTTAPNTGSNTPEHGPQVRTAASSSTNVGQARHPVTGVQGGATSAAANLPAASIEKARALPGGGFRVEQDPETCTWWLDVLCPTDQEMKTLSRAFGIHPLTTEDILMEEIREKIELFRNYYLVCFRSFDQDPYSPTYLEPLNMYVIVFREGTLSFHFRATPHPQNVRRRIKQLKDYINVTSDWISYALIDDITDAFGPLIQSIEYEVDSIDELVLILKEAEQSDMLRRIGTCRKKVMGLLRLMGNKADVVKGLAKRCNENWSVAPKSDIGLYLSDIQDHLITMTQNLNHYEKILSRSHSNYLAQISIEMTDANNQINDVLSKLTALGTVIVPLNVITGLWGMNVNVPGQGGDGGSEGLDWFFGILGVMIALAVIGYFATIRYLNR